MIALDHLPEIAARSRELLARNRAVLDQFLASRNDLEFLRPPAGTVVFPRLKPVSYTHLDVYKRQLCIHVPTSEISCPAKNS